MFGFVWEHAEEEGMWERNDATIRRMIDDARSLGLQPDGNCYVERLERIFGRKNRNPVGSQATLGPSSPK